MANICDNTLYVYSEDPENIKYIKDWFRDYDKYADIEMSDDVSFNIYFESRWIFPKKDMDKLFENIPNKEDIYMRCLSVEYGNDYVSLYKCEDEDGWFCVV